MKTNYYILLATVIIFCSCKKKGPDQQLNRLAAEVSRGLGHSVCLDENAVVWATGYNGYGQLGDGTITDKLLPIAILSNVKAVAAGGNHCLFLRTDGSVWATGNNY